MRICSGGHGKIADTFTTDPNFFQDPSGCTAVVGLVTADGRIIVANSGDSRSVLGYKGQAKALSNDHKPTNKGESSALFHRDIFVDTDPTNDMQRRQPVSQLQVDLSSLAE